MPFIRSQILAQIDNLSAIQNYEGILDLADG